MDYLIKKNVFMNFFNIFFSIKIFFYFNDTNSIKLIFLITFI